MIWAKFARCIKNTIVTATSTDLRSRGCLKYVQYFAIVSGASATRGPRSWWHTFEVASFKFLVAVATVISRLLDTASIARSRCAHCIQSRHPGALHFIHSHATFLLSEYGSLAKTIALFEDLRYDWFRVIHGVDRHQNNWGNCRGWPAWKSDHHTAFHSSLRSKKCNILSQHYNIYARHRCRVAWMQKKVSMPCRCKLSQATRHIAKSVARENIAVRL